MTMLRVFVLAIALLSVGGCGTLVARFAAPKDPPRTIYPASKLNSSLIYCRFTGQCSGIWSSGETSIPVALFNLVDFPISVASDTLFLPFDALNAAGVEKKHPANEHEKVSE